MSRARKSTKGNATRPKQPVLALPAGVSLADVLAANEAPKAKRTKGQREQIDYTAHLIRQLVEISLPEPVREFAFARPRRFRADAAYPERRVLIEVEGGIWVRGRHTSPQGYRADVEKYNLATLRCYSLLRFTPDMILDKGRDVYEARDTVAALLALVDGGANVQEVA